VHFDGTSWSVISTPALSAGGSFAGVAAASSSDVWAVGAQNAGKSSDNTLIEHWNGTSWSIISSPPLPNGGFLTGVTAVSMNNAWAVGTALGSTNALVEHWDGTSWSIASSPAFNGVGVGGIAADGKNDIWAVGGPTKLHFDGTNWSLIPAPTKVSTGAVTALSPTNAWAVGGGPGPPPSDTEAMIEHWDGSSWSVVASPNPDTRGTSLLSGVAAVSDKDIFAVGEAADGAVIEHWNGRKWSLVTSPGGGGLDGVTALSDGTVVIASSSGAILEN
jgi:hypothetical protein